MIPQWPEGPPLDITVLARHIQQLFLEQWRESERNTRREFESAIMVTPPGETPRIDFSVSVFAASHLGDRVIELLQAYDYGRTQHIEFLKKQLMEYIVLYPRPFIIEK